MYCNQCGNEISDSTRFCPQCGASVTEPVPDTPAPAAFGQAAQPKRPRANRPVVIAAVAAALVLVAAACFFVFGGSLGKPSSHPVLLTVSAQVPEGSSRIPVHVTGADSKQNAVDETQYVDLQGQGVSLLPGQYELAFPCGPLTPDGSFYRVDNGPVQITIDDSVKGGDVIDIRAEATVTLVQKDAKDVTDEEIELVASYAKGDPSFKGNADECKAKVVEQRDAAVKKAEEERAVAEAAAAAKAAEDELTKHDGTYNVKAMYVKYVGDKVESGTGVLLEVNWESNMLAIQSFGGDAGFPAGTYEFKIDEKVKPHVMFMELSEAYGKEQYSLGPMTDKGRLTAAYRGNNAPISFTIDHGVVVAYKIG